MLSIALAATKIMTGLAMAAIMCILVGCASWKIVYNGFHCRKAPIQKAALLTAVIIWGICAAVINFI